MRSCRVIFGATYSQYLLTSTIQRHGENYKSLDPEFCHKAKLHFYVDDLINGVRDVDGGILLYRNIKERLLDANFNIRKWRTNNERLRNIIEHSANLYKEENLTNHYDKLLSITWNDLNNILVFVVKEMHYMSIRQNVIY